MLRGFPERRSWSVNASQRRSLLRYSCHTLHRFGIAQASRLILWIENRCRMVDDANIQLIVAIKINMASEFTVKETERARWYRTATRGAINR
jgi:3-deoxy-D-arabino-heptulosonate 7-phosphate (DAHP) synthase class II